MTQRIEELLGEKHRAKENEEEWGKERVRYESEISKLKEALENSEKTLTDATSTHTEYLVALREKLDDQTMSKLDIVQRIEVLVEKNKELPDLERKLSDLEYKNRELEERLENKKSDGPQRERP